MNLTEIFNFNAIKTQTLLGLKNTFDFKGKTRRIEFIQFAVGVTAVIVGAKLLADILRFQALDSLADFATLLVIIPSMAIVTRRFRDLGKNALPYILVFLSAIVGFILFNSFHRGMSREVQFFLERFLLALFLLSIALALRICIK